MTDRTCKSCGKPKNYETDYPGYGGWICITCVKIQKAAWYQKNKKTVLARRAKWWVETGKDLYHTSPEYRARIEKANKKWRAAHPEQANKITRLTYYRNQERIAAKGKEYRDANKERLSLRKRELRANRTQEQIQRELDRHRAYRLANRDRINATRRKWYNKKQKRI